MKSGGKMGSVCDGKLPKKAVQHVKGGNKFASLKPTTIRGTKAS
jgi:hypothetical protein